MDDGSILSDRERRVEDEVESEHDRGRRMPDVERDAAGGRATDSSGPADLATGGGRDETTATGGRTSEFPGESLLGAAGVPGVGGPAAPSTEDEVENEDRPGESYSPRSG